MRTHKVGSYQILGEQLNSRIVTLLAHATEYNCRESLACCQNISFNFADSRLFNQSPLDRLSATDRPVGFCDITCEADACCLIALNMPCQVVVWGSVHLLELMLRCIELVNSGSFGVILRVQTKVFVNFILIKSEISPFIWQSFVILLNHNSIR